MAVEKIREIYIRQVDNGYIVQVGCKNLIFPDHEKLIQELGLYLLDPIGTTKSYADKYGWDKEHQTGDIPVPEPCERVW